MNDVVAVDRSDRGKKVVSIDQGTIALSVTDVTNMYPVKATWWEWVDIGFRAGFNWDKSIGIKSSVAYNF